MCRLNKSAAIWRAAGLLPVAGLLILTACQQADTSGQGRQRLHLPASDFVADATRGQQLFQASCAACHGQDLGGTDKGPPLVHAVYRPSHHADLAFQLAVQNGVRAHHWPFGDMAPIEKVTPEDVANIIAYVRKEQQAAGIK